MDASVPRLSKKIPNFCRKKQRNLAYVKLDGKQRFLGPYDDPESRHKYDRLIALWIAHDRRLPDDWELRIEVPSPASLASAEVNQAGSADLAPVGGDRLRNRRSCTS